MPPTTSLTAFARALARRDATFAVLIGAVVGVACLVEGFTYLEAAGAAALSVPLAWRRRAPLAVLAVVTCGAVVYLALARPSEAFQPPMLIALYTVAAHGTRRRTLAIAAALVPGVLLAVMLFSPFEGGMLQQFVQGLTQFGLALAIGEAVRTQRALIGAMRERAERAEREREQEARRRVDEERVRIARDVHDVVAHSIATISTQASVGVHVGREEPERAVEVLESIKRVSAQALHDLRHALGVLRDAGDEPAGPSGPTPSLDDLPELVRQARDSGLSVVLQMEGSPAGLPTALQVAIYRIVQEGLTNVLRHAGGARSTVRIAVGGDDVEVTVSDDGTGSPTAAAGAGAGSGLEGMQQRASAMGGAFEAGERPGGGFRVRAVLPLDRELA